MSDVIAPVAPPAPPANAQEARTRLAAFVADNGKGALLLAGDIEANREFTELSTMSASDDASTISAAMNGDLGDMPSSSEKLAPGTADMLRSIGIRDEIIEQQLKGHVVTPEEYKATEAWKARTMKNQVWVKAYLDGDPDAVKQMALCSIILSGGVIGETGSF